MIGSPFPSDQWRGVDFDDSSWVRQPGPLPNYYRSLALICLRGKFEVIDPAAAGELSLSVKFQGGIVAYLNGVEVGRAGMPEGKIDQTTLADKYPRTAYADSKGAIIPQTTEYPGRLYAASEELRVTYELNSQEKVDGFKSRARSRDIKIPATAIKKGVNVLSLEIHRAPADPIIFTSLDLTGGNNNNIPLFWNRAAVESIALTATPASAGAIKPNISRPEGVQVWQEDVMSHLGPLRYGDPNEAARPIRLTGMKNGVFAGEAVVGSRTALHGLKAVVSDLTQGASTIPASAISVGFPGINNDAINPSAMLVIPTATRVEGVDVKQLGKEADLVGAVQPVWIIVSVGRDTPAGKYTGTLTITTDGEKPVVVPVELKVIGDWVLPDPQNFTVFMGVHESADSVAMQYNTPLWSEEHWKNLDKIYELLGQIGTKDIYLPVVAKTHLANEQSMVRWIKQPDGTHKLDFTNMERYLDIGLKHLGKVPVVCLYLHDYGFRIADAKMAAIVPTVTEVDSVTGAITELKPPEWGTPEARAFWKPVVDGTIDILKKRGMEKSLMFGMAANNWVNPGCVSDLKTMYPDILWVNRSHYYVPAVEAPVKQKFGLSAIVGGVISVFYDPDLEHHFGWKSPELIINFPRFGNVPGAVFEDYLSSYRIFGESCLLSGGARWRSGNVRGVGHIGADFWPVLKDAKGVPQTMGNRYVFWHSLSIAEVMSSILGAGTDGPVATTRQQMMRESLQEAEVRVYVQNVMLDKSQLAKLPPELAARCKALCDERTGIIRYYSQFCEPAVRDDLAKVFDQHHWVEMSEQLYQAASDVQNALAAK